MDRQAEIEALFKIEDVHTREQRIREWVNKNNHAACGFFDVRDGDKSFTADSCNWVLREGDEFFREARRWFGPNLPDDLRRLQERFLRNKSSMMSLAGVKEYFRQTLPPHYFPPYFDDFDTAVKKGVTGGDFEVPLEQITFSSDLVGNGGTAAVYQAKGPQEKMYALKFFHLSLARQRTGNDDPWPEKVLANLRGNQSVINKDPFVRVRGIPQGRYWYLMDYVPQETVASLLEREEPLDDDLKARAMLTYGLMLKTLHGQGLVFGDNNWGAVLVGEEIRICDLDTISPPDCTLAQAHNRWYGSYEQQFADLFRGDRKKKGPPLTYQSEVESFAAMVDHILLGLPLYDADQGFYHLRDNKREYPSERRERLPRRIQEIVPKLLTYPRDDSIKLDDMIDAIRTDFKV